MKKITKPKKEFKFSELYKYIYHTDIIYSEDSITAVLIDNHIELEVYNKLGYIDSINDLESKFKVYKEEYTKQYLIDNPKDPLGLQAQSYLMKWGTYVDVYKKQLQEKNG